VEGFWQTVSIHAFGHYSHKLIILPAEMGLGKTIMVASLIHANMPSQPRRSKSQEHSSSSSDDESYSGDDSEKPYVPSPVAKQKRQSKLNLGPVNGSSSKARSTPARAGRYNATLVIAPTSLLNQWRDELVRSSKGNLQVLVYNDQKDMSTLVEELDGGVDVVVASYGKVGVEFDKWAGEDGKGFARKPKEGIYCVDWFRVILDEAHTIKSRSTRAARACYAIKGKRRWCLSGTPIVNRLEDLYSLLHFIRCE
jgi:DNA repair protein RAD5